MYAKLINLLIFISHVSLGVLCFNCILYVLKHIDFFDCYRAPVYKLFMLFILTH